MNNPKEIDEVFDKISYKKGASLIRMLHSLMGEEDFKQGIRSTGFRNVKVLSSATSVADPDPSDLYVFLGLLDPNPLVR